MDKLYICPNQCHKPIFVAISKTIKHLDTYGNIVKDLGTTTHFPYCIYCGDLAQKGESNTVDERYMYG